MRASAALENEPEAVSAGAARPEGIDGSGHRRGHEPVPALVLTFGPSVRTFFRIAILGIAFCVPLRIPAFWYVASVILLIRVYESLPYWVSNRGNRQTSPHSCQSSRPAPGRVQTIPFQAPASATQSSIGLTGGYRDAGSGASLNLPPDALPCGSGAWRK
jgi:hypothetical protein